MKYIYFCTLFIIMLTLSACGRNSDDLQQTTDHVLTILARRSYEGPIRQAERNLIAEWEQRPEKEGHTFRVELTTFWPDEEIDVLTRLDMMLMAGQAYDIFFPVEEHRTIRAYAQAGFLTDIYPLMRNCPRTNVEEDFFTNALDAWKMDGGLYIMPWHFGFSYAFVNTALPQSILDRFTALERITVAELTDMYRHLLYYYAHEFEHFHFSHGSTLRSPEKIISSYIGSFIDFENNKANLMDDAFITFLADFVTVFDRRHLPGLERQYWTNWWASFAGRHWNIGIETHSLRMIARGANSFVQNTNWGQSHLMWDEIRSITIQPHAFIVESRSLFPASAVMHQEVLLPYFTHGIPLVGDSGGLLIADNNAYPAGVAISAATDPVAWDFTRHLINAFNRREVSGTYTLFYANSLALPIVRDLVDFRLGGNLTNAYSHHITWNMFPCIFHQSFFISSHGEYLFSYIPAMVQQMTALAEQPMALTHPPIPEFLYANNLDLLLRGLITPRDFAQRTQNAVSLWLLGG